MPSGFFGKDSSLSSKINHLIYDWNDYSGSLLEHINEVSILDESLRDGLQSPSVVHPTVEIKIELIKLMCKLGISYLDLGFPGASPQALNETIELVKVIEKEHLPIHITCAARTHPHDIQAIIDVSQAGGVPIEVLTFLGSSPIRSYVEEWRLEKLCSTAVAAVDQSLKANLPVAFVTEDTTRSSPDTLKELFTAAIHTGAQRLILCDTVGHATPKGVTALVTWTRELIQKLGTGTKLDWHGHNDRGFGVINALYALQSGCDRIHATALGIGERAGNTAMDQLLVNLKLLGFIKTDLSDLMKYCSLASQSMHVDIPKNYPIIGDDAFRTATGVHAAAILKAKRFEETSIEDLIYSAIPAKMVGRKQIVEIGPMSGKANVLAWLIAKEIFPKPELVENILEAAKKSDRVLKDKDIQNIVDKFDKITQRPKSTL